jgi:hypothetical protein
LAGNEFSSKVSERKKSEGVGVVIVVVGGGIEGIA